MGLYCCMWVFSICRDWGLSSCGGQTSYCICFSCYGTHILWVCRFQELLHKGSVVVALRLSCLEACGSSQIRNPTCVPWVGREIATREVWEAFDLFSSMSFRSLICLELLFFHLELILYIELEKASISFFCIWTSSSPSTICWKDCPFTVKWSWHVVQNHLWL